MSDTSYIRHYCYRIDFADSFTYFGVRSCRCLIAEDLAYMGSPITHKAKWLTDIPRVKTIVSVHATRELAEAAEDELILAFWAVSKELSLNAAIRGVKFHRLGAKHTAETRAKMSGKKWHTDGTTSIKLKPGEVAPDSFRPGLAEEHRAKMSNVKKGEKNPAKKSKTRAKLSAAANKPENRQRLSERMTGLNKVQVMCPHCSKTGSRPPMLRWHFDNCKHNERA